MRLYHFTEMPYPFVPPEAEEANRGLKYFMPNRYYDPVLGHELYQRYLDEYELADELGFDLMVNEHHQSASTLQVSATLSAASVLHRTRRGRVLVLGTPLPHRESPIRVAEEIAYLDSVSGGRIDCGFVRGVQGETFPSNQNPVHNLEMFIEAHDLIKKAWTSGDVFSWEGRHYHYRYVSVWPRPYQQPHPPIWISGTSTRLVEWTAQHGYTLCNLLGTYDDTATSFRLYRRTAVAAGQPEPGPDRFAYMALCHVAPTEEKARDIGRKLMYYLKPGRLRLGAASPPGYFPPSAAVAALQGRLGAVRSMSYEDLIDAGILLVGTPDQVTAQIHRLYERTGVGHLILMNHAGDMTSNEVRDHLTLFAREVMPAVTTLGTDWRDQDTTWRVDQDHTPVQAVLSSALS
ncbi:LLM class flavin-dependent oxidoreductase [Micromonospora sp. NPDC005189]|uniref:LLM class flavin-dependent oxidoreductase n=1 Tax=unclassified Micromonospora TaxID=2617518 RepID=UPI0033A4E17B